MEYSIYGELSITTTDCINTIILLYSLPGHTPIFLCLYVFAVLRKEGLTVRNCFRTAFVGLYYYIFRNLWLTVLSRTFTVPFSAAVSVPVIQAALDLAE